MTATKTEQAASATATATDAASSTMRSEAEAYFEQHPDTPLDAKELMTRCSNRLEAADVHATGLDLSRKLLSLMDEQVVKWDHSFRLVPGTPTNGER